MLSLVPRLTASVGVNTKWKLDLTSCSDAMQHEVDNDIDTHDASAK